MNSPYSGTGSTDGTVASNSVNGSLDRTANYVDSLVEADKTVTKLRIQAGLGVAGFTGAIAGLALLGSNYTAVQGAISVAGAGFAVTAIVLTLVACGIAAWLKFQKSQQIAKITDRQEKELQKQAQQNIKLSATLAEKEVDRKAKMGEENLTATYNINKAKNQARQIAANTGGLEQSLSYANLGHTVTTAINDFDDIEGENVQDFSKHMQKLKLLGLDASRINKGLDSNFS